MSQRTINLIAAAIVVVGGAVIAIWATRPLDADDHEPAHAAAADRARTHPAPLQAYAQSSVGEWSAYRIDNGLPSGHVHTTVVRAITAVEINRVTRTDHGRVDGEGGAEDTHAEDFPRSGLTLERLTGDDVGGWTISDETVGVEQHTVGGRQFRATRVSYASQDPLFPKKQTHTDLWLSDDVPAGGLIAKREEQILDGVHMVFTEELVGYGDETGPKWGDRPSGL